MVSFGGVLNGGRDSERKTYFWRRHQSDRSADAVGNSVIGESSMTVEPAWQTISGWWFFATPSEKYEFVKWDKIVPKIHGQKNPWFQSPPTRILNHLSSLVFTLKIA